jgi:hypothetical protein
MPDFTGNLSEQAIKDRHIADTASIDRDKMAQRILACKTIPLAEWRVWDAVATNLPGTPAADDLGLVNGTFGTNPSYIGTGDLKAAGATNRYARAIVTLPEDYEAAETVNLRVWAGMITTVADTSAVVDFEVWRQDKEDGTLGASDICATSQQSINSLTENSFSFNITATTLEPGDQLDVRLKITVTDAASATAVIGAVYAVELLCDRR